MAKTTVAITALSLLTSSWIGGIAHAQNFPISAAQRQTAQEVAQKGVPLSELAPDAPDSYTVKKGDTLWAISSIFIKSPWKWPELWGMNLEQIKNPHRIYPGQTLVLERKDGRATLKVAGEGNTDGIETVRVSPRTRYESLAESMIPALKSTVIEAFLAEPQILTAAEFNAAPRIVANQDSRVLLTKNDIAYARGPAGEPLLDNERFQKLYRVFREATPLRDPVTQEILGYETVYLGTAKLTRSESTDNIVDKEGKVTIAQVPAGLLITSATSEIRVGDRIFPAPPRQLTNYVPHAPSQPIEARIVSIYGSAVAYAAQNQVVTLNKGTRDGLEAGHVLAILKDGPRVVDRTDPKLPLLKLPNERNGLLMVFRTFDRMSYGLIVEITDSVRIGDRLVNPR